MQLKKNIFYIEPIGNYCSRYTESILNNFKGLYSSDKININLVCDNSYKYNLKGINQFTIFGNWQKHNFFFRYLFFLKSSIQLITLFIKHRGSLAHLHYYGSSPIFYVNFLISKIFCKSVVITIHDVNNINRKKNRNNFDNMVLKMVDFFIFHNDFSKNAFIENYFEVNNDKYKVIHHGNYVDYNYDKVSKFENNKKLLFFGQIKESKGLDILLKAFSITKKKYPNSTLTIAGNLSCDFGIYKNLIKKLNIQENICLNLEFISFEDVKKLMNSHDIVVLPYKEIYQSGVLMEALSYGKLVIASDLEAFANTIVDNKSGFLFRSEDEADLAKKIIFAFDNPNLCNKITKNLIYILQTEYSWKKSSLETIKIYTRCLTH